MAPRTQLLRPGVPVLRRSPGVLQVGLAGPVVRLPDVPAVRGLLDELTAPAGHLPAPSPGELSDEAATALRRLVEAELVVPAAADPPAYLLAQAGPDAVRRQEARAAVAIALDASPAVDALLTPLLAAARLGRATTPDEATVRLVVADGPHHRERLDPLVRGSVPHLLVAGDATGVRIGPFVVPGRTACLRCVDAHESLRDERLPLLVAQAARQCAERPPPRDPVLDRLALAWAVRDLTRFAEGAEPSTWSSTVDLGPAGAPLVTRWGRHPWCGCAWDGFLDLP
ncbi:hypothetical protein [Nocardioides nitrophenolicus]|uniref:hypothetical protein n=1 Tax=Nocardioides nitrophenolicus TaxID=60489 RepID=UPI0019571B9D|nr:hypothetical protein [Nocardioides nitrophenolicus]MBM7515728.1 hypothetical protein [Nocardioides nitrophenolicus]